MSAVVLTRRVLAVSSLLSPASCDYSGGAPTSAARRSDHWPTRGQHRGSRFHRVVCGLDNVYLACRDYAVECFGA